MSVRPNFYLETKWNSSRWAWPDLVNDAGLQVHEESPGDVLACPSGWEESREGVVVLAWAVVVHHHPVRTDPVLQTVQLPGINIVTWCDIILTIFKFQINVLETKISNKKTYKLHTKIVFSSLSIRITNVFQAIWRVSDGPLTSRRYPSDSPPDRRGCWWLPSLCWSTGGTGLTLWTCQWYKLLHQQQTTLRRIFNYLLMN